MVYEEIFTQLSLWRMVIFGLNLTPFASIYPLFSCVDLEMDPYSVYGSGYTKLLNTDPDPQHCPR